MPAYHPKLSRSSYLSFGWQFAAPLTGAFFLLLLGALFLAHQTYLSVARQRDLARVQRYVELSKAVFEARYAETDVETILGELRRAGLDTVQLLPLDEKPAYKSPRYGAPILSAEAWSVVHDTEKNPVGILRVARVDDSTHLALQLIRTTFSVAILIFLALLSMSWLLFRRRIAQRVVGMAERLAPPASTPAAENPTDPLEALEQTIALHLSEEHAKVTRHQRLQEGHSEAACTSTTDGTLLEVNAAYCRLFGKTREELVGSNYLDLIPPADRTDAVNNLRKLSHRTPESTVEHRVVLNDGSVRWMRWRDTAVLNAAGQVKESLSFGLDITAEKNLAEHGDNLGRAFDQMQSLAQTGSLTWNLTTDRMDWTMETRRLLGLDGETPSLERLLAIVCPGEREPLRALFHRARENGASFEHEFRVLLPGGGRRTLQSRAEVRADPQTKILNLLTCTLRDITALRDAEAATKRELRFREAVEQSLASGIVASDDEGRILSVNPAFCAMTGWTEEELIDLRAPYPYWPEEEIVEIQKAFDTTLGDATPPEGYALRFCRKDGSRFDVLVNVAPLLDAEDRRLGWLGSVTDITALQETRRRLREANERLETARDIAALGTWSWNPERGEIQWDARSFEIYGHPGATDAVAVWRSIQPAAETARAEQNVLQAEAEGRTSGRFLISILWPDGSEHTIESSFRRLRESGTNLTRFIGVHRDITAEITRERELRTTNERLETAQQVVEFGIWDWDPVRDKLFWDRSSFALFGRPDATDAEAVWAEVLSEEERERLTYQLQRLIATGGTSGQDLLRVIWPDGSRHEISSTYLVMRDDHGKATRVFGVNRDITRELEAENELRDANERLAAALEGGNFGTFEHIIGQGDFNYNLANYEINGIDPSITDPAELFAAWQKITGEFFPQLIAEMSALPATQTNYTYEFTARPANQEPRRIRVSLFIERNKQGHPVRLVGITRRLD